MKLKIKILLTLTAIFTVVICSCDETSGKTFTEKVGGKVYVYEDTEGKTNYMLFPNTNEMRIIGDGIYAFAILFKFNVLENEKNKAHYNYSLFGLPVLDLYCELKNNKIHVYTNKYGNGDFGVLTYHTNIDAMFGLN